jgi:translation initiation factor IF-3
VKPKGPTTRINEDIRSPLIRVIAEDGEQLGVMHPRDAQKIARERGLDLVEIAPQAEPPVCRIIDFGKFRYEQQKRDRTSRKRQHTTLLKEVRLHPNTDEHDFEFKAKHAHAFLMQGHKVKAEVVFKGREIAYKQFGEQMLKNLSERLADIAKIEQDLRLEGTRMSVIFSADANKKKKVDKQIADDKRAEDRRNRPRTGAAAAAGAEPAAATAEAPGPEDAENAEGPTPETVAAK